MGSDKERDPQAKDSELHQHEMTLPRYFIGRYPVTVAQFRVFIEDSGYRPDDEDCLQGVPNHPVVSVTWYEALKYCDWLTERLKEWPDTPEQLATVLQQEGWRVSLPSEAEWEKAVRGIDGRIYPWGNKPDPDRDNYHDTGIGTTSAVGCFPGGASPYGIVDLSGNVAEQSGHVACGGPDFAKPVFAYPYQLDDGRENQEAPDRILRVVRGGQVHDGHEGVRCAYRDRNYPSYRHSDGFRVVVRSSS